MKKQIFENLLKGDGCVTSDDLTADEKKRVYDVMQAAGMTDGTTYNRFFRDGFKEWELTGIRQIVYDYAFANGVAVDEDDFGMFYRRLPLKTPFKGHMNALGMSPVTTQNRFNGFNFKGHIILFISFTNTFAMQ